VGKYIFEMTALRFTALALAGLLLPSLAWSAGLGKLAVLSALGQPLRAEIEVSSVDPGEADSLSARAAAAEAYAKANIERAGAVRSIRFAVDRRSSGQYVVLLTSVEPMNEPFLELLVELNSTSGRLVRGYTFLLDPPGYKPPVAAAAAPATISPAPPVAVPAPAAAAAAAPVVRPANAAVTERSPAPAPRTQFATAYTVKRGDTLTKIAIEHKQPGVSLQQMLVALYRGNLDAFDGKNMNRMRAGKILTIPASAAGVSKDDAVREIAAQNTEFAEYRRQIGVAVAEGPAGARSGRQAAGKIGAPRVERQPPPAEPTRDQLRLAKAGDEKAPGDAGAAARADDLAAKDKALKEANERIAILEKNLRELQKLIQLKSEAGAQMQQAATGAAAKASREPVSKAAPAAEAAKAAAAGSVSKAPEAAQAAAARESGEAAKAAPAVKAATAAAKAAPAKAARKAQPPPPPPPPPEPSFLDEFSDPRALVGGVLVVFVLYTLWKLRERRRAQAESSVAASAAIDSTSGFGAPGEPRIDTAAASFRSEFGEGISKVETEEIDPIAEADVYMAYGRDTQAEEILKEALGKDATRHAIRGKLLEIYANRKDLKTFAATARELHAATGGQGPEWDRAVSLGRSVDADNPLFAGASASEVAAGDTVVLTQAEIAGADSAGADTAIDAATQAAPPLDFDLDLGGAEGAPASDDRLDVAVSTPEESSPSTLDFDLDLGGDVAAEPETGDAALDAASKSNVEAEVPADDGSTIDFDLGPTAEAPAASTAESAVEPGSKTAVQDAAAPDEDAALTMDFDLGAPAEAAPTAAEAATQATPDEDAALTMDFDLGTPAEAAQPEEKAPEIDMSAFDLDLGDSPAEATDAAIPDAHWQEVATKLDLAKAYEEMGDKDGARELLNEVAAEGDAAQKQQANALLAALD